MRVYFGLRPNHRYVRGGHIIDLQTGIARTVHTPLGIDGVYGRQTERAVRLWQNKNGHPETGSVDEHTWTGATGRGLPSQFRRCLAVTAAFEGHGYTFAAGNWDNAYLTWGVIGFTLKHGNFGTVIRTIQDRHPGLLGGTIGQDKSREILDVISAPAADKRNWADAISLPPRKYRVRRDWEDAFKLLGRSAEVQTIQDEIAYRIYWKRAVAGLKEFGQLTESDAAMFFDTAVQNGGVNDEKDRLIRAGLAANPGVEGRARLEILANAIADGSNPDFRDDVFSRRNAIATGQGVVHEASYFLEDWAVGLYGVTVDELGKMA